MRATIKTIKNRDEFQPKKLFTPLFLAVVSLLLLMAPSLSSGVEKTPKAQPKAQSKPQTQIKPQVMPIQKETIVNDANLMAHQKRVEDLVGKSDFNGALKIMLKINDYTKEVLFTVKNIKTEYEKAVSDPRVAQKDKEDLFIKMRGLDQLIPRYTNYYEASTFNLGYMYAKLGETEKARKYLVEFLQMTPYSGGRDSQWMKAKTLLLELYSLEGEF
jgi:tetratricopeptide (TPR) repeat protein